MAKTERLLREALVSLVHEKNYDAIVVRDILERANVGRSAFYAHFRDKHELLENGIQHMLRTTPLRHRAGLPKRFEKALWFSGPLFEYVDEHRHADSRMDRKGRSVLHEHLKQSLIDEIGDDVKTCVQRADGGRSRVPTNVLVEYIVTTFILVLNWWVESRSPLTASEVDDVFLSMVVPALEAVTTRT